MTRVRTMPLAGPPSRCRALRSASWMAPVVVSVRSIVIRACPPGPASQPPPCPAIPCHQGIGARRARRPGLILLGLGVLFPEMLDGVKHLPGQFDLLVAREQRRVADENVDQKPFVGFRAAFGKRFAVG